MNALTPPEVYEKVSDSGIAKANGPVLKLFVLGILAGAFIAFGAQASLMASFNLTADPSSFGVGKVVMAAVFPVGLMMVVLCGAELFTGNCLMITGALDKKFSWSGLIRNWGIVYIGNLVGSLLIVVFIAYSGLWDAGNGLLGAVTVKTAIGKCSLSFGKAIVLGIMCNILVCLAVWMATASRELVGKIFAIWFCIGLFIVSGFEHSVANMYFIPAGMIAAGNESYLTLLNLDASSLGVGAFLIKNLLPVTIGNIIGGSIFVGGAYWLCYSKWK